MVVTCILSTLFSAVYYLFLLSLICFKQWRRIARRETCMPSKPQRRVGRPTAAERMVQLPPIYVPPSLEAAARNEAAGEEKKFSDFGRDAFEFYLSNKDKVIVDELPEPEPTPANVITVDLAPELYEQLAAFSRSKAIKNLSDFIEHLAERVMEVKPETFHKFFYDDTETVEEALEAGRTLRDKNRSSKQQPKRELKAG